MNRKKQYPNQGYADPPLPPPLSFYTTFMRDAQCAESNEKSISLFFIFRVIFKINRKFGWCQYKNDHNFKNEKS